MAPRLFIFTEGKTEVLYFEMFKRRGMPVSVIPVQAGNTDIQGMVDYCLNELRLRGFGDVEGDRAFVVFDRDRNDREDIRNAEDRAGEVGLLMSNPSFEYWLILHFSDEGRAMTQDEMEDALERLLGRRYCKGADISRQLSWDKVRDAVTRARGRLPAGDCTMEMCFDRTPSTMVYVLVSELLEMVPKA